MKTVLLGLILASSALSINRIRRDGKERGCLSSYGPKLYEVYS